MFFKGQKWHKRVSCTRKSSNLYITKVWDLQGTPECNIPKEGETASPSRRSLCAASAWAGRWFPRLRGAAHGRLYSMTNREHSPRTAYRSKASVTISFCVGLSRGPLRGLPDSARMTTRWDLNKKNASRHPTALITWWSRQDRCTWFSPASPISLLQWPASNSPDD